MIKDFNSSDIINSKELNKNFINANSKELKLIVTSTMEIFI